jgi:hypothetical protein
MLAEITCRKINEIARRLRDHHLPAARRGGDSRRPMHHHPDVPVLGRDRLASVQPDTNRDGSRRQRILRGECRCAGVLTSPKRRSRRVDPSISENRKVTTPVASARRIPAECAPSTGSKEGSASAQIADAAVPHGRRMVARRRLAQLT